MTPPRADPTQMSFVDRATATPVDEHFPPLEEWRTVPPPLFREGKSALLKSNTFDFDDVGETPESEMSIPQARYKKFLDQITEGIEGDMERRISSMKIINTRPYLVYEMPRIRFGHTADGDSYRLGPNPQPDRRRVGLRQALPPRTYPYQSNAFDRDGWRLFYRRRSDERYETNDNLWLSPVEAAKGKPGRIDMYMLPEDWVQHDGVDGSYRAMVEETDIDPFIGRFVIGM